MATVTLNCRAGSRPVLCWSKLRLIGSEKKKGAFRRLWKVNCCHTGLERKLRPNFGNGISPSS
jgi:hypothetical protein